MDSFSHTQTLLCRPNGSAQPWLPHDKVVRETTLVIAAQGKGLQEAVRRLARKLGDERIFFSSTA